MFTYSLENHWTGSVFEAIDSEEPPPYSVLPSSGTSPPTKDTTVERSPQGQTKTGSHARHIHRQFKFAPRFGDVRKAVAESKPGNDGLTVEQGLTRSVKETEY